MSSSPFHNFKRESKKKVKSKPRHKSSLIKSISIKTRTLVRTLQISVYNILFMDWFVSCIIYNQFYLTNLFSHKQVNLQIHNIFLLRFTVPTTIACTWWNRPEEDLSSGKFESTHPSRTVVKSIEIFYGVESVVRGNADSLLNWAADHRTRLRHTTSAVIPSRWCAPEPRTVKVPLLGLLHRRH